MDSHANRNTRNENRIGSPEDQIRTGSRRVPDASAQAVSAQAVSRVAVIVAASVLCLALAASCAPATSGADGVTRISGWQIRPASPTEAPYDGPLPSTGFSPYDNELLGPGLVGTSLLMAADVTLPEGPSPSMAIGPGSYPRDVWIEGRLVKRTGDHLEGYSSTLYYAEVFDVPPDLGRGGETVRVTVISHPRGETGAVGELWVGPRRAIAEYAFWRNFLNVNLIQASFVAAFILAIYFFFIWFAQGRSETKNLEFALTCLAFALSYSNMSLYHDGANQDLLEKASRVGFPLTSYFLGLFALRASGVLRSGRGPAIARWSRIGFGAAAGALCLAVAFQPDKDGVAAVFGAWGTSLLLPLMLVATLALFVAGVARNRSVGAVAMLAGFLGTIAASVHDIAYVNSGLVPFCYLVPYGYLALVLSIFFVLSLEQAKVSRDLKRQGLLIATKNKALQDMVTELSVVAEGLVSSSADMESTLSSTLDTVEQFGNDNRAITDSVSSQVREVEEDIERIARSMAYSAERVPKAIESQTAAVEQVTKSLDEMGTRIDETLKSADATSRIAGALAKSADESAKIIGESREAISRVSDFSRLLADILKTIEDIAERTNVLSINAAIESAKFGAAGKGFAVVAQEIRNLANQSQTSLATSFERIKEMGEAILASDELSNRVSDALGRIIDESRRSSGEAEKLRALVEDEREQSRQMLKSAAELVEQARALKDTAELQTMSNVALDERLTAMRKSFEGIAGQLSAQAERRDAMFTALGHIHEAVEGNSESIGRLRDSIEKAHDELSRVR